MGLLALVLHAKSAVLKAFAATKEMCWILCITKRVLLNIQATYITSTPFYAYGGTSNISASLAEQGDKSHYKKLYFRSVSLNHPPPPHTHIYTHWQINKYYIPKDLLIMILPDNSLNIEYFKRYNFRNVSCSAYILVIHRWIILFLKISENIFDWCLLQL